jgi:23S rRNA (uracil1939-C5)-methyltransferase
VTKPRTKRKRSPTSHRPRRQLNLWGKDTVVIERMSQEGRGIANRQAKIVFVSGALIGEQVRVQCTAVKRDYDTADMIGLLPDSAPSPMRVLPQCPIYGECGGCTLQHWSPTAQQQHKHSTLLRMLQPIAPGLTLDPPIISYSNGFRHRVRLLVTRHADKTYSLGFRQRRSHNAVNLQHCVIANAAVNTLLQALPKILFAAPELQGLREIEIDADSNNQLGLCFYFAANPGEKILSALRTAVLFDSVIAMRVRLTARKNLRSDTPYNDDAGEQIRHSQELYEVGELTLRLQPIIEDDSIKTEELQLAYLPGDFTQTHWDVNMALVSLALNWLKPHSDEIALDLFSGIGNFSLPFARRTKIVYAIEGDTDMVLRVKANAQRNGIENIRVKMLNLMTDTVVLPKADIAIVDPPRAGAKSACETLARSKVKRLAYVSCHPATLVRDARVLCSAGFHVAKAAAVDMFPHSGHSEAIVLFER